jgi:hypothetical protein
MILFFPLYNRSLLISCSYCDNGTEFKGEFQDLYNVLGIKIIQGRSYHPQTQGSVKQPNHVFKKRLAAISSETGCKQWVYHLLAIEEVMNMTSLSCLLSRVTLDEVWFGYKV